ncbi:beta-4C adrenergic receptor-like [Patiria miniata]|uniref:G-protein coupled receptors family 1 profile domain-containing protein n=1 Tax=Patiria miniata TaxID=46514 RepID=A0A914BKK0_PATMI|nr:beta-4C adrenergic receptor-like [Patiria miniata]
MAEGMDVQTTMASGMTTGTPYTITVVSVVKACLLAVTTTLILLGNSLCLIVLRYTHDGVSPVTKLFLISLTISDLLVGVLVGVPVVGSTALQSWPYGDAYCTVVAMCHALYFNAGMSVLAINIERYIAVIWPLRYPSIVTMTRAAIAEVCIICILVVWTLLYVLIPNRSAFYYNNFNLCFIDADAGDDVMGQLGMTLFIALPMLITVMLHIRLFFLATRHASKVGNITLGDINSTSGASQNSEGDVEQRAQSSPPTQRREGRQRVNSDRPSPETKAARTFFIMALVAAISWTPYYTTISWENFREEEVPEALAFVAQILLLLNSLWNVVIYYARNDAFRKTANRLLGCCFRVHSTNGEVLIP